MASEAEQLEARLRLKRAREAAGKTHEELSKFVGHSTCAYYDLEDFDGELYETIGLGELSALCSALGIKSRELFDDRVENGQEISPEQLISKARARMKETAVSVADFSNLIGFEIQPSLDDISKVMDWNVDFLRWLCRELELDWRLALP